MTYDDLLGELDALSEEKFRAFTVRLLNTGRRVLGVRTPALRSLAKRVRACFPDFIPEFFARSEVTHEEVLIAGWQTGKDYGENIRLLLRLIPLMDSWAQTDQVIGRFGWAKDKTRLVRDFERFILGGEYEKRAFVVMLMTNCMDAENFRLIEEYLPRVPFGEYYVDMAAAWLLCEAVLRFPDRGNALLASPFVTPSVRKKTGSKLRDSLRSRRHTAAKELQNTRD